ncbi:MAG TPA: hypothetical protein VE439_04470 [Anaerolineae bacterium]|nr:hypothetical protein [Anaerolineae bacterium]
MRKLVTLIRGKIAQLRLSLRHEGEGRSVNNQHDNAQVDSANYVLMQEYESLKKSLESVEDPIERYKIMRGLTELELVIEKRRLLAEYSEGRD